MTDSWVVGIDEADHGGVKLNWTDELERWLEPFMDALGHSTRWRMCPAYVAGLIGPGDRKSVRPMAARDDGVNYEQLHNFIGSSVWDAAPLDAALLVEADKLVGGEDAWLIVDGTALPKNGRGAPLTKKGTTRLALHRNTPPHLARPPTVSRWFR